MIDLNLLACFEAIAALGRSRALSVFLLGIAATGLLTVLAGAALST